jgi:hypothetical protein
MSVAAGPNVVANGLVLEYDMSNTDRSWKGAPTTNLYPGLGLAAVQGVSYGYISTDSDGWMKYGLNGTWASGGYPYSGMVSSYSFTGGVYYTTSCWIKTNVPSKFANLFTGMNYVNQPMNSVGTSFSVTSSNGDIFVGRQNFCYTSTTTQNGYFVSNPTADGITFNSSTDFVWIKQGQIEVQPFPTPYTDGTRSATQALLDLTGQNILTAASLTYASDNTFSFNGSGDSITTVFKPPATERSLFVWVYFNTLTTAGGYQLTGTQEAGAYTYIGIINGGNIYYYGGASTGGDIGNPVSATTWVNLGLVINADGSRSVYKNGVAVYTAAGSVGGTPTLNFQIGMLNNSYPLNGKCPVVQVYNRALSAAEVAQNFNAIRVRYGI